MTKPTIPISFILRELIFAAIPGALLSISYMIITNAIRRIDIFDSFWPTLFAGALIGVSVTVTERFVLTPFMRKISYFSAVLISALCFSVIVMFWLWVFIIDTGVGNKTYLSWDFMFALIAAFIYVIILDVKSLLNHNFLWKYLAGHYHSPRNEERIFMFLDLRSSTYLAETLGSPLYSTMLQELFSELTRPIIATRAEVYQYVGDEVILTWPAEAGLQEGMCLHCYFYIEQAILAKKESYQVRFGAVPKFKAAVHVGNAVATMVGDIKREVVYHGDVLNATARMQAMCNDLNQDLLTSGELKNRLITDNDFVFEHLENVILRGKTRQLDIFGVGKKVH